MAGFHLDMQPFNEVLNRYLGYTEKEMGDEINRRATNIVMRAMANTPRVDANSIPNELGANLIRVNQRVIKSGKRKGMLTKGKLVYTANPQERKAYRIFNWRRRFRPDSLPIRLKGAPTGNKHMKGLIGKFVNSVKSSCGYITAGWIPALTELLQVTQGMKTLKGNSASNNIQKRFRYIFNNQYASQGGAMISGSGGPIFKVRFTNAARGAGDEKSGAPNALRKAFAEEAADMQKYLGPRLQALADKAVK
jgi:hypothetical protein